MADVTLTAREKRRQRRLRRCTIMWLVLAALTLVSSVLFLMNSSVHYGDFKNWILIKCYNDEFDRYATLEMPRLQHCVHVTLIATIGYTYGVVILLMFGFSKLDKFWELQAVTKFVIGSILPGVCLLVGDICKDNPNLFIFIIMVATSLLFIMLAFRTPEDFGMTDMLVAIGLAFFTGPHEPYWKFILVALPAAMKALIPIFVHCAYEEDSVIGDLEPSVRGTKWELTGMTKEQAKEFVDKLNGISELLQDIQDIQELGNSACSSGSDILQHIQHFKSRLENVH